MPVEVRYIGGFEYLEHNHLVIGQKYIVEGSKVYSYSRNSMIVVTAEQMIQYFELVK